MTTDAGTPTPLRQAMIAFDDFLNEPPEYEGDRTVRWYRHEAYRKWVPVQTALTAAEAERDALRQAMGFAQGAIEDAIYTEDGLDGETGERVLHIMQEAVERGTFDQTQIGSLPRPMLETENDALRARVAGLENSALELSVCLRNLVFMAETSGGTAGRDEALCTAIAQARALLAPSSEPQP